MMKMDEQAHDSDYEDTGVISNSKLSTVEQEDGEVSDGSIEAVADDEGEIVEEETNSEADKEAGNHKAGIDISKKTALEKLKNMKFNFKPKLPVRSPSAECRDRERRDRQLAGRTDIHSPNRKDVDDERRQRKRRWEERSDEDRYIVRSSERPKPLRDAVVLPPVRTPEPQKTYDQPTTLRQRVENLIKASETEVTTLSDKDLRNLLMRMIDISREQQRLLRGRKTQTELLREMHKQVAEDVTKLAGRVPTHLRMDLVMHLQSAQTSSSLDGIVQVNGEISNGISHGQRPHLGIFPLKPINNNATPVRSDPETLNESDRSEQASSTASGMAVKKAQNGSAVAAQNVTCYSDNTVQPPTMVSDTRQFEDVRGHQSAMMPSGLGGAGIPPYLRPSFSYLEFGQGKCNEGKTVTVTNQAGSYDTRDRNNGSMADTNSMGQEANKEQVGSAPSVYLQDTGTPKVVGGERIDANFPHGLNAIQNSLNFGLSQLEQQNINGPQTYISNEKAISVLMGAKQSARNASEQKVDPPAFVRANRPAAVNSAYQEKHMFDRNNQTMLPHPSLPPAPLLLNRGREFDGHIGTSRSASVTNPSGSLFGMFEAKQPCRYADTPQPPLLSAPPLPLSFGKMSSKSSVSASELDVHTSCTSTPGFPLSHPAANTSYSSLDTSHPPPIHHGSTSSVNVPPPDFSVPPPIGPVFGASTPALASNIHNERLLEDTLTPQMDSLQENVTHGMSSTLAISRSIPRMNLSVPPPAFNLPPPRSSLGNIPFAAPHPVSTVAPSASALASNRGPSPSLMSTPPPNIAFKKGQSGMHVAPNFPPPNISHPLPTIRPPVNAKNSESIQQMVSAIVSQSAVSGQSPAEVVSELIANTYSRTGSVRLPETAPPANRIMPSLDPKPSLKNKGHAFQRPPRPLSKIHIPTPSSSRTGCHSGFGNFGSSQSRNTPNRQQQPQQQQQQQQHQQQRQQQQQEQQLHQDKRQINDMMTVIPVDNDEKRHSEGHDDSNIFLIVSDEEDDKK